MTNAAKRSRLLAWRDASAWRPVILSALSDLLTPAVIAAAQACQPGYLSSAPPHWLEDIILDEYFPEMVSVASALAERLPTLFRGVRAFHGCRPTDARSYLSEGILPLQLSRHREVAVRIFADEPGAPFTREQVIAAAKQIEETERGGRLYLALDDRELLKFASHYLIRGSEYLQAVAAELYRMTGRDSSHLLWNRGTPTVFVVDLPWRYVNLEYREYLSNALLSALFLDPDAATAPSIDFTLTLRSRVAPRYISGHHHPTVLKDPHRGYIPYRISAGNCPLCGSSPAA